MQLHDTMYILSKSLKLFFEPLGNGFLVYGNNKFRPIRGVFQHYKPYFFDL